MPADAPAISVPSLLKKTEHYDKDERYMATSDLCEILKSHADAGSALDIAQERQICTAVLRLLDDKSNDVQAVAVKTLSVLLTTVQPEQVLEIADSLADHVLDVNKSELRDVYAIGLRTLLQTIPATTGDRVAARLTGRLLEGIRSSENTQVCLCSLDTLTVLLERFGSHSTQVTRQHEPCLQFCLALLQPTHPSVVRKRAGATLACLAAVLSDKLLQRLLKSLLQESNKEATFVVIRTLCTLTAAVGHRLQQADVDRILTEFGNYTKPADAKNGDEDDPDDDEPTVSTELRESCFVGFENLLKQCPLMVENHVESTIMASALAFMSFDPNYAYGDEGEDSEMQDETGEDDDDDDMEDEYDEDEDEDDDDDESWKVRRSAIRVLKAIIQTKEHDPSILWTKPMAVRSSTSTMAGALLSRFKEREENCRVEIMEAFQHLLQVAIKAAQVGRLRWESEMQQDGDENVAAVDLEEIANQLVKTCLKILDTRKGQERSKSCALSLFRVLCQTPSGIGSTAAIASVLSRLKTLLSAEHTNKTLRLDALETAHAAIKSHQSQCLEDGVLDLLPSLCEAVQEQWYKVIAEALRALTHVPRVFAESPAATQSRVSQKLVEAVQPLMETHDVDLEIKECALGTVASLISLLQLSPDDRSTLLSLLLQRLENETTRVSAMKNLATIAAATNIDDIVKQSISTMATYLKYASRTLTQSALETLDVVISNHGAVASAELYETDVLPALASQVSVDVLKVSSGAGSAVKNNILEPALKLSVSSHLQESSLDSLLHFFQQMVSTNSVDFKELWTSLTSGLSDEITKAGCYNLAECMAVSLAAASKSDAQTVLADCIELLEKEPSAESSHQVQLALLTTGALGRRVDLTSFGETTAQGLKKAFLHYFDSSVDDLTHAAACALGNASVGSHSVFLNEMVQKIDGSNTKQQYLVLSAFREFIKCGCKLDKGENVAETIPVILPPLEKNCSTDEEGIRSLVAECLGLLACLRPEEILPKLESIATSHAAVTASAGLVSEKDTVSQTNSRACWTVATAVKLAAAGKVGPAALENHIGTFIGLLKTEAVVVRTSVLHMIYSVAHHSPQILTTFLSEDVLPDLFTISRLKLQRKVDLGPFTHTVDDALPMRKAALSIFATCLEKLPGCIDISSFMPVLAYSLGDAEDVQLHAYQIVSSMASKQPSFLVASIESFVEPLEKTINKKSGQKTGTELERLNEWISSAIRVAFTLSRLDGAMNSRKFVDFLERTKNNSKIADKVESVLQEPQLG